MGNKVGYTARNLVSGAIPRKGLFEVGELKIVEVCGDPEACNFANRSPYELGSITKPKPVQYPTPKQRGISENQSKSEEILNTL